MNTDNEYVSIDLGLLDLPTADIIIEKCVAQKIKDNIPDLLLFLSYKSCLAVGARQLDPQDFLKPQDYFTKQGIPLYKSVRGGGLTYHWPGQLVCYPILKMRPHEQNIPGYMSRLEEIGLQTLAREGVNAHRKRDKTAQIGLWVENDKIASMGIRVSRWVTSYGFALNLSGDVSPAHFIRPCGLDVDLTTVELQTNKTPDRTVVKQNIQSFFEKELDRIPAKNAHDYENVIQDLIYECTN